MEISFTKGTPRKSAAPSLKLIVAMEDCLQCEASLRRSYPLLCYANVQIEWGDWRDSISECPQSLGIFTQMLWDTDSLCWELSVQDQVHPANLAAWSLLANPSVSQHPRIPSIGANFFWASRNRIQSCKVHLKIAWPLSYKLTLRVANTRKVTLHP